MQAHRFMLLCAILFIATACVSTGNMLPGSLYRLTDGTRLSCEIQTSTGTGSLAATDPSTGEKFTGQYTGTYQGGSQRRTNVYASDFSYVGTIRSYTPPSNATARGVLRSNKGTVIELFMDIQPGYRPRGSGEGIDNKGRRYQVQF